MLGKVLQLRAVRYDLKTENPLASGLSRHIGFIAQEIEQQFPEFVVTNGNGYKSVTYDQLTPVLVEAIKEQQKEIESLKAENEKLRYDLDKFAAIEARLKCLEETQKNNR